MLISLNWLNEYVDIKNKSIKELENALTMIGQEVEKIENKYEYLDKVVTAKIVEYKMHEDSDHLTVCKVDNGKEILQVVCGASNHKNGDIVALAQVGTKLSPDFEIKKGKIRGVESNGMLCSQKELGLGEEHNGIIIFPQDTPIGVSLNKLLGKDDIIFELEITPNRPDCLSYIGIARELGAYYGIKVKNPSCKIKEESTKANNIDVKINDEKLSKRYVARIIENVKVGPSPKWLKDKLESLGMKSINNIVDASNFVMLEQNQPNHIFDLDKLSSNSIEVDTATDKEKFITLDNQELELDNQDIVIKANGKAVALAGVMGGLNTCVDDNTKNILLEVAHFNSQNIRKTSRKYTIISESSYRFERRVDSSNLHNVVNRLANVIQEVAGGQILYSIKEDVKIIDKALVSTLNLERLYRFVGKVIDKSTVIKILENLEIKVVDLGDNLELIAPSFRADLVNEQDYFEEIIRMYGFDNIENVLPRLDINKNRVVDTTKLNYIIKEICSNLGLREVINYSFIPKKALELIKTEIDETNIIEIENPITEDFAIMRSNLMYSLLKNVKDNFNKSFTNIRFFEVSKVFEKLNDKITETENLAVVLAGATDKNIYDKGTSYDFYDIKGIFEKIFEKLGINSYRLFRSESNKLHPGRSADIFIGKEKLASFGEIHPDIQENFGLENKAVMYLEVNILKLSKYIKNAIKYKTLSKYQSTTRDLALVAREEVLIGDVLKAVEKIDPIVQKVELFDIYRGIGVELGYKSFAISILMRDANKTLEEKDINAVLEKIKEKLSKDFGAILRQ
ncbi:phenylalanine--tRNA ligase subunit beta [Caviibacter abscessus]|uniref:phenylalanine--tRNA ligase subunit beta n=1 Tax=Caviibacter abscessus TaxID=1766719 RepID=UPI0008395900|nr:phenylalanine--tRNA ligase subunit beta [Caviibacter abscessus]